METLNTTKKTISLEWFGQEAFSEATRDTGIENDRGVVRLVRRVVLADEMGNCNGRDVERVDGTTWARKDFWLDSAGVAGARVSLWVRCADETAELIVEVNGRPLTVHPLSATLRRTPNNRLGEGYWQDGWRTAEVHPTWLKSGRNAVILRTADGSQWETLIETNRFPNRSAKSVDGGQTWDFDHLGYNDCYDGEYLVRLELDRYPDAGRITSSVFDLALAASEDALCQPVTLYHLTIEVEADTPDGTVIYTELRAGPTPSYDPAHWSPWQRGERVELRPDDRFAQWRATLTTAQPLETPLLRAVLVTAVIGTIENGQTSWGSLLAADNPPIKRSSNHFGYQAPTRRTKMMRERWQLEKVVAGAQNDFEQILRLAHWTREQWTDGWNPEWKALHFCPPWDAPLILELGRHDLARGMCTHYSAVFVHACAAMGITARHVIHKGHCTVEAWSNHWKKWIWVDAGGDHNDETMAVYYVVHDEMPLSALEARSAWLAGDVENLSLVGRNAEQVFRLEHRLGLLDRFCISLRNDHMTSLNPGEPEHGAVVYHYDGYLWWRDEHTPPLPWFSLSSGRIADFYWSLNQTRMHLQRTAEHGVARVQLESSMPNLETFEIRLDDEDWQERAAGFDWQLHPGRNRLSARAVNAFGVQGTESWVTVAL